MNIIIEYNPGANNAEADNLSSWAYPAGAAQDTNFHVSDRDLAGWTAREQEECAERQQLLQRRYPEALGAFNSMTHEGTVCQFSSQEEALRLLKVCCNASKGLKQISATLDEDEIDLDSCILDERSAHEYSHLSHPLEGDAEVHEGSINTIQEEFTPPWKLISLRLKDHGLSKLPSHFREMSWHMPGVELSNFYGMEQITLPILRQVLTAIHTYAHPGIDKTMQMFKRKYMVMAKKPVPDCDIKQEVETVVKACQVCQAVKNRRGVQPDTMEGYPIPDDFFSSIAVDFVSFKGNPVRIRNETYDQALVVVCRLSGYVTAVPCNSKMTQEDLADLFVTRIFLQWGLPKEIFSDHDKLINSQWFQHYCQLCGVEEHKAPVYKPKANGRAENAVGLVVDSLRKILEQKCSRDWVRLLPLALWALNDIPGPVWGYTPHRIVYGSGAVGFEDVPPTIPKDGRADAATFFYSW